jgi:hypothetical protein
MEEKRLSSFKCALGPAQPGAESAWHISTASRDLGLSDSSIVSMRRALDRVEAAQRLLETMKVVGCSEGAAAASTTRAMEI